MQFWFIWVTESEPNGYQVICVNKQNLVATLLHAYIVEALHAVTYSIACDLMHLPQLAIYNVASVYFLASSFSIKKQLNKFCHVLHALNLFWQILVVPLATYS